MARGLYLARAIGTPWPLKDPFATYDKLRHLPIAMKSDTLVDSPMPNHLAVTLAVSKEMRAVRVLTLARLQYFDTFARPVCRGLGVGATPLAFRY